DGLFVFSSSRRHPSSKRDWSSDVCSSDLAHLARGDLGGAQLDQLAAVLGRMGSNDQLRAAEVAAGQAGGQLQRAVILAADEVRQIGRASCRERGSRGVGGGRA